MTVMGIRRIEGMILKLIEQELEGMIKELHILYPK